MTYLKYLWFIGILAGACLIKAAWYDTQEGPFAQFIGLVVSLACLIGFLEAYRRSLIADINGKHEQSGV